MSGSGGGDGGDGDEPRFLGAPPQGPDPDLLEIEAAKARIVAQYNDVKIEMARVVRMREARDAARAKLFTPDEADYLQRCREAQHLASTAAVWDRGSGWRGAWVEQRLGGLRVTVPGHWRRDVSGQAWEVPDRAMVSVHMFGFEKSAPPVAEYMEFLRADRRPYERAGVRDIVHPHDSAPAGTAAELIEHAPEALEWPMRCLRIATWTETTLLCLKLDVDGLIPDDIGTDFARTWRSLH